MRSWGALALALIALLGMPSLWSHFLDRMIFQPTPGADLDPADVGLQGEEVFLTTEDGVRIHGFFLPSEDASRALLFLHGNAGNASHRLPNAAELVRLGIHVLLLDYRGYGRSEGTPSEAGAYADARAGLAHLIAERQIPEARIVLFGRSLGGAVAVDLARKRALAGLILESTFTSARDVAGSLLPSPVAALLGNRFASDRKIAELRCPLLAFHGDRDDIIGFELGRRLYDRAPQPKAFEILHGAGHNDTVQVGGAPYFARIAQFLEDVAPEALP